MQTLHQNSTDQRPATLPGIGPSSPSALAFVKKGVVAATAVLFALGLSACSKKEPAAKVEVIRPVVTVVVGASGTTGSTGTALSQGVGFSLPAETRARIETRYGFRIGGKLSQRLVTVGDSVNPGQLLARLDPQDVAPVIAAQRAALEGARTELKLAQLDLGRTRDLREKNFVSQSQLDRQVAVVEGAQARFNAAEAQVKQAQNSADFQYLKADVAGIVTAVEAEVGQVVAAGQSVYRVAQAGNRDLLVNVPEVSLSLAKSTTEWLAVIPSLGPQPRVATLREISPLADAASRTYAMKLSIPGGENLPLGLSAVVQPAKQASEQVGFLLPIAALYSKDGKPNVWLVDAASGSVKMVPVQTAGFTDEAVRLTGGVKQGDRVVIAGASMLIPGQKVKVQ